jgi:hypothetical protein
MRGLSKSLALLLVLVFMSSLVMLQPATVKAQTKTITVPDDYQNVASAIGNSTDGDTILIKPGTYEGQNDQSLIITKSISLVGKNPNETIIKIHPTTYQYYDFLFGTTTYTVPVIDVEANHVKISGLTVSSDAGQMVFMNGNYDQIIGCILPEVDVNGNYDQIMGCILKNEVENGVVCHGSQCLIADNIISGKQITGPYDGISVSGDSNTIHGNSISNIGNAVYLSGTANIVNNNTIQNCQKGIEIGGSLNSIYANKIENNVGGLELFGQGSNNAFYDNYVFNNSFGIFLSSYSNSLSSGVNNTAYHNNFVGNVEQIKKGGGELNVFPTGNYDNGKEGNYWSDYNGSDANGDGVGDTWYNPVINRIDRYPLMYPFGASAVTLFGLENATFVRNVFLNFTLSKPVNWTAYSLDDADNVTVNGNLTLSGLSVGSHNLTVYASDMFGNVGASKTVNFTIAPETFPITPVAVGSAIFVVCVGLLVFFKKRKHQQ